MPNLLALDWGTSRLRAALLDASGTVRVQQDDGPGIQSVAERGGFTPVFVALCADIESRAARLGLEPPAHTLVCGMAGSRQGWAEAPYCPCPADAPALAAQVHWLQAGRMAIVPGVCSGLDTAAPDVMRGEEVQVLGAAQRAGVANGTFVLPGTHSKWVQLHRGRIGGFATYMTGEFYGLLAQHSLLARMLDTSAPHDPVAFDAGLAHARQAGSVLHAAFATRTRSLLQAQTDAAAASYLSGVLIGEELRANLAHLSAAAEPPAVHLVGEAALVARYAQALTSFGVPTVRHGHEATWAGLHALAQHLWPDQ